MQDWMFQQEGFGLHLIAPLLILRLPAQIADQTETKHPSKSMKNLKRRKENIIEEFECGKG